MVAQSIQKILPNIERVFTHEGLEIPTQYLKYTSINIVPMIGSNCGYVKYWPH